MRKNNRLKNKVSSVVMCASSRKVKHGGSATIELSLILPLVLIPILIIGVDLARAMHARNTLASALHIAGLAGINEFSLIPTNAWIIDANGLTVDVKVENTFETIFAANKGVYDVIPNLEYLCQCSPPAPNTPSALGACNANYIIGCADPDIKIFLSSSAQIDFETTIHWPGFPSEFPIGPLKAVFQMK